MPRQSTILRLSELEPLDQQSVREALKLHQLAESAIDFLETGWGDYVSHSYAETLARRYGRRVVVYFPLFVIEVVYGVGKMRATKHWGESCPPPELLTNAQCIH